MSYGREVAFIVRSPTMHVAPPAAIGMEGTIADASDTKIEELSECSKAALYDFFSVGTEVTTTTDAKEAIP